MKHYLKSFAAVAFIFTALILFSCQNEENETTENPETLAKSSELTGKLSGISEHETSLDNVIDSTSCFSINLPFQVATTTIGPIVTIDSIADYQIIEDFYAANPNGSIQLIYPVTVTFADYTTAVANNDEEFNILRQQCDFLPVDSGTNCFSVNYPITLFGYDSNAQLAATYTIHSDLELFTHILTMTVNEFYSIDFPISATNQDGETITVNNNTELLAAINTALTDCGQVVVPGCDNPHVLTDSLIMYIPFANEIVDLKGFGNPQGHGSYHFVPDRSGNPNGAISFDSGTEDTWVDTVNNSSNNMLQTDSFTVSIWFSRKDSIAPPATEQLMQLNMMDISLGNTSNNDIKSPFVLVPGLVDPLYDIGWIQSGLMGEVNVWHHIVITRTGSNMKLYRDGVLQNETDAVAFSGGFLGGGRFAPLFKGYLDDIRIYKAALTPAQVSTLYNLPGDVTHCLD